MLAALSLLLAPNAAAAGISATKVLGGSAPAAVNAPVVPGHQCTAPAIPKQFDSPAEQDAFAGKAEAFHRCIEEYAAKQAGLSKAYGEASNRATREWNRFAAAAARIEAAPEP